MYFFHQHQLLDSQLDQLPDAHSQSDQLSENYSKSDQLSDTPGLIISRASRRTAVRLTRSRSPTPAACGLCFRDEMSPVDNILWAAINVLLTQDHYHSCTELLYYRAPTHAGMSWYSQCAVFIAVSTQPVQSMVRRISWYQHKQGQINLHQVLLGVEMIFRDLS